MTLESLLLSADPDVLRVVRPTLEQMSVEVEICNDARAGADMLISEKFDAVIVDCDDLKGGLALLQGLRNTPSNRHSVAFAILNGKKTTMQDAFGMGANFVLQKPVSVLNTSRCFHAALNFMIKERRRYFRHPVKMRVNVILEDKTWQATSRNLSEGGIALMLHEALPKGAVPHLRFALPSTQIELDLEAEIAWTDTKGLVGFRFHNIPKNSQAQLERWLDERMEQEFPGAKEQMAAGDMPATN